MDIHRQAFREEAADLLGELETALLELEDAPEDTELINRVFRSMHTLKGSGAMFGFDDIAHFTHHVETVFDLVRSGELPVTKQLLDLTLAARDHVTLLFETESSGDDALTQAGEVLLRQFRQMVPEAVPEQHEDSGGSESPVVPADSGRSSVFRVRFKPGQDIYSTGNNPEFFLDDLRELGECLVFAYLDDIPLLSALDPLNCHVWWDVLLTADVTEQAIRDVFLFVEDDCELLIQSVEAEAGEGTKKLGEILIERGDITPEGVTHALRGQKRLGVILAEAGLTSEKAVETALAEQGALRKQVVAKAPEGASSLRVPAEKLDVLQDLVGELVIVQAQIKQAGHALGDGKLQTLAEQLERLSNELRDSTLAIRMLPIGSTFGSYRRLVRDLSAELGKQIELVTRGEDTELDKTVLDWLGEVLVHLLRNSIDHGLELPQVRMDAGKPACGVLSLVAEHSGGDVLIQVIDDGRGIDPDAVRKKAVQRGLIAPDAELSRKEILELIFAPGFSTAEVVSSVSGRGVGMDVVKRVIHAMRGSLEVESETGKGSTVSIRLPLTLAIIDGLQVQVGGQSYVLPLDCVEECLELVRADIDADGRNRILNLRGEIVPFIHLREWFVLDGGSPTIEQVVVMTVNGQRVGMVVDHVVGEHQTVIKGLGPMFRKLEGFSGATIQSDGTMSLILDVKHMVSMVLDTGKR